MQKLGIELGIVLPGSTENGLSHESMKNLAYVVELAPKLKN